jgi:hypothetical protein
MSLFGEAANRAAPLFALTVQVALEELSQRAGQGMRVSGSTYKTRDALDDGFTEGSDIGSHHRNAIRIGKKRNAALEDAHIRQHNSISRLEKHLNLIVRDESHVAKKQMVDLVVRA